MRTFILTSTAIVFLFGTTIGCKDSGTETDVATAPQTIDAAVTEVSFANTKCPIMGGTPTEELTAEYQGETIGFCCEGCPEKWAELTPEEQAEKFAKVSAATGDHDHAGHDHGAHDHGAHDHGEDGHDHDEHGDHAEATE